MSITYTLNGKVVTDLIENIRIQLDRVIVWRVVDGRRSLPTILSESQFSQVADIVSALSSALDNMVEIPAGAKDVTVPAKPNPGFIPDPSAVEDAKVARIEADRQKAIAREASLQLSALTESINETKRQLVELEAKKSAHELSESEALVSLQLFRDSLAKESDAASAMRESVEKLHADIHEAVRLLSEQKTAEANARASLESLRSSSAKEAETLAATRVAIDKLNGELAALLRSREEQKLAEAEARATLDEIRTLIAGETKTLATIRGVLAGQEGA